MTKESVIIILGLVVIHYIADFICQDEQWAINKWTSFKALLRHTMTYSYIFSALLPIVFIIIKLPGNTDSALKYSYFILITFILHTLTDFITSKYVHKLFEEKKFGGPIPNLGAFSAIGFDQVLHYFQLVLTYYFLFK